MRKIKNICLFAFVGLGFVFFIGNTKVAAQNNGVLTICDTNSNGAIDLDDVNKVLKYALTIESYADKTANGDVDQDGSVTLNDVNMVLKYALTILEIPTETPIDSEVPTISPNPTPTNIISPTPTPTVTTSPTPTPIPTETVEPTPTVKVWTLKESVEAFNNNLSKINQLAIKFEAKWHPADGQPREDGAEIAKEAYELCGITLHVDIYEWTDAENASILMAEKEKKARNAGYDVGTAGNCFMVTGTKNVCLYVLYFDFPQN